MKKIMFIIAMLLLFSCDSQKKEGFSSVETFQLAPPIAILDSTLFMNAATIDLDLSFPDAQIYYTTNGSDVTKNSPLYETPVKLEKSTTVKAKAFHKDYRTSEQIRLQVAQIKNNISNADIRITPQPNSNYSGNGDKSLIDLNKGTLQFRNGNHWLGFQANEVTIDLKMNTPLSLSKLLVSVLIDQGSWIFSPDSISVFSGTKEVGHIDVKGAKESQDNALRYVGVNLDKQEYTQLKIVIHSLDGIPEWHQGKGTPPWLFIDEILVE